MIERLDNIASERIAFADRVRAIPVNAVGEQAWSLLLGNACHTAYRLASRYAGVTRFQMFPVGVGPLIPTKYSF